MARRMVLKDLKAQISVLFLEQGRFVVEICEILGVRKSMVYQTLVYIRKFETSHNPLVKHSGCHHTLTGDQVKYIRALLVDQPTLYLNEIQDHLARTYHVSVSLTTLICALCCLHYS